MISRIDTKNDLWAMEALRGLAILSVLILHTMPHYGFREDGWMSIVSRLAVPLFFSVSGFCISLGLFRRSYARQSNNIRNFWRRRFHRIYPPYIIAALIYLIKIIFVAQSVKGWEEIFKVFVFNATLTQVLMGPITPLNPAFWSLCVEFQFYIIVSLCLLVANYWKNFVVYFVVLLSCLALSVKFLQEIGWADIDKRIWFGLLPNYSLEFLVGVGLAWYVVNPSFKTRFWLLAISLLTVVSSKLGFMIPLFITFPVLLRSSRVMGQIRNLKAVAALCYAGEWSYSIYLIHGLGIAAVSKLGYSVAQRNVVLGFLILLGSWATSIIGGYIYYKFVERRFMNRKVNF